jgi:hypothetical protein
VGFLLTTLDLWKSRGIGRDVFLSPPLPPTPPLPPPPPSVQLEDPYPPSIGRGGKKSDIFRLGLVLVSLVTGRRVEDQLPV